MPSETQINPQQEESSEDARLKQFFGPQTLIETIPKTEKRYVVISETTAHTVLKRFDRLEIASQLVQESLSKLREYHATLQKSNKQQAETIEQLRTEQEPRLAKLENKYKKNKLRIKEATDAKEELALLRKKQENFERKQQEMHEEYRRRIEALSWQEKQAKQAEERYHNELTSLIDLLRRKTYAFTFSSPTPVLNTRPATPNLREDLEKVYPNYLKDTKTTSSFFNYYLRTKVPPGNTDSDDELWKSYIAENGQKAIELLNISVEIISSQRGNPKPT